MNAKTKPVTQAWCTKRKEEGGGQVGMKWAGWSRAQKEKCKIGSNSRKKKYFMSKINSGKIQIMLLDHENNIPKL